MPVYHFYRQPGVSPGFLAIKLRELQTFSPLVHSLQTEICFNVGVQNPLSEDELIKLKWLLSSPFHECDSVSMLPFLEDSVNGIMEVGPRLSFSTPLSSNAVAICKVIGLFNIERFEVSTRYKVIWSDEGGGISMDLIEEVKHILYDQMTEMLYSEPISNFSHGLKPEDWYYVNVLEKGREAIKEANYHLGLAFDEWDIDYYTNLFKNVLKRNPTSVECFDLAQSNSEHSRHWFFKGKIFMKGKEVESLMDMVIKTQQFSNQNNVIKFCDNSSAIHGFLVEKLSPQQMGVSSVLQLKKSFLDIAYTAETHNFPTGVSPFSGAATGVGGRIRDIQAVGRGGYTIAGTAGYAVGNLLIPNYIQPWENRKCVYPPNFASPLKILIEASNGASDYGNKFGEPLICGYTRCFGLTDFFGERREWVKPIMFSGGLGAIHNQMISKIKPQKGMKILKIGGPVYRIGVGGGSASSINVQGDNKYNLDYGAVQRGDAEMENKMNRVIRGCIEDPTENPIYSIHDQGAGGNGNVLKELVDPVGAIVFANLFSKGDTSVSALELWGAEYQESNALLINAESCSKLQRLAKRERCPIDFVGVVTGTGKIVLSEEAYTQETIYSDTLLEVEKSSSYPVDLDLETVLGKMPQKKFYLSDGPRLLKILVLPPDLHILEALNRVLRLGTICSKRFLTTKVDRCVTGLVAQQQCVGPLHTPLADCAVIALSIFNRVGAVSAIGEQPIKGLINPEAGGRMSVAESLTNLTFAPISNLKDVKCSGNWMWAAKLPEEGFKLYTTCKAMCEFMSHLGIAVDGGKDSLSMAARVNKVIVKAPGALVVSAYVPCPDITKIITPDIKSPQLHKKGSLLWIKLSPYNRLGGSGLAQCFSQVGHEVPDVEKPELLKKSIELFQQLIMENKILAGHDVSDGGFITCVLEMAFAGLSGLEICLDIDSSDIIPFLFSEEVGWIIEVKSDYKDYIMELFRNDNIPCSFIGFSSGYGLDSLISLKDKRNGAVILEEKLLNLLKIWEETSYKLEQKQANPNCAKAEFDLLSNRKGPTYKLTFNPNIPLYPRDLINYLIPVAVIREEGVNGDREMAASLYMAGFEVWDVTMEDLLMDKITLHSFRGLVFPGGFSFGDVLGSAKGWAACLKFSEKLKVQFEVFASRSDTFGLGVCNGCQLMSLLGWIGVEDDSYKKELPDIALEQNYSERFECRFSTVRIEKSPSILFKGMEGSILGVWVAHGEGRFEFRKSDIYDSLIKNNQIVLTYADDDGNPTEIYPLNPNGSKGGLAGICSKNGRFVALMPHPERCTQMWQWPFISPSMASISISPWLRIFENAYIWAKEG